MKIRLHIPGIPYSITREEYTDCAFTGKVLRFGLMMQSRGFEVYHYGVETSTASAFTKHIDLLGKDEWTELRIKTFQFLDPSLTYDEAKCKNADPMVISNTLSNWNSPLAVAFNARFKTQLKAHYRSHQTDVVCIPLGMTYDAALADSQYVVVESGIGYGNSCKEFRVFESHTLLAATLEDKNNVPNYWFVIPNYYNLADFTPVVVQQQQQRRVGFLGRVTSTKGCHIVVEVARRFPDVTFVLCGPGHPEAFVANNVVYEMPVHGADRSRFLGSCVAILCPSQYLEPFCGVSVEAQLCGTPVICADHGAFADNVEHKKTGLRCHTLGDYCHGVRMALDGAFDREYIATTSRRKYDMYTLAADYEYVFQTVLDIFRPGVNGWYAEASHLATANKPQPPARGKTFLVIPYFGQFPSYFQLYLDSLAHNVDVLTVVMPTDLDVASYHLPPNLVVVPMSLDDIRRRLAGLLMELYGKVVAPEALLHRVYKLVDVKIIYPLLFADLYDGGAKYVGWGDIDVIYGKLRDFVVADEEYDILGGWHGHFTAIRNTDEFKRLFLQIPNYLELVLDNDRVYIADEIQYRGPLVSYLDRGKKKMCFLNATFCDVVPPCFYHLFRPDHADRPSNFFNNKDPQKDIRHLFYNHADGALTTTYTDGTSYATSYCHLQKRVMDTTSLVGQKRVSSLVGQNGYYILESKFAYSSVDEIPLQIFQTWEDDDLPPKMRACVEQLKAQNPEFEHRFFTNVERRAFLVEHFAQDVVNAYDALIPGAYRADLWRYCVMYIHGGLYLDIKLECVGDFRLLHLYNIAQLWCSDGHFLLNGRKCPSVYNGILLSAPRNPVFWGCIQRIVQHVQTAFYGSSPWEVTGPQLLGQYLEQVDTSSSLVHHVVMGEEMISDGTAARTCFLRHYAGYREEVQSLPDYRTLWTARNVYRQIPANLFQTWSSLTLPAARCKIVLLLTSTVVVGENVEWLRQRSKEERLAVYRETVKQWRKETRWPIVFVENSGFRDLGFEPEDERFEVVSFLDETNETSKGRCEMVAIRHAFQHSRLLQSGCTFVVKLTGRYYVPGLETYLQSLPLDEYTCLTQNDKTRCEMVGAHVDAFSRIFQVEGSDPHVETTYRKRAAAAESNTWTCPEFHIAPTARGGDGNVFTTI